MPEDDSHLREQLDALRATQFEQIVDEQAMALAQTRYQEQDAISVERAIIIDAKLLRNRIIDIQAEHLKRHQATTRLGKWLLSRHSIPEIRFGLSEDNNSHYYDDEMGSMTIATAPLLINEEETADGKVINGWVFELESPIPEAVGWFGSKEPPIHSGGDYRRSSINIYRVAEDKSTGLQAKEKWFTINPDSGYISCLRLAEQRGSFLNDLRIPEENQRVVTSSDEENDQINLNNVFGSEVMERDLQIAQIIEEQIKEHYAPDLETGLHLLGILHGSLNELSEK